MNTTTCLNLLACLLEVKEVIEVDLQTLLDLALEELKCDVLGYRPYSLRRGGGGDTHVQVHQSHALCY